MAFKVKDLMVNVLPSAKPEGTILPPSPEPTDALCELASTAAAVLSKLQKELKVYLELEELRHASENPQTIKEIDVTTKKLDGELKMLRARRAKLSRKPRPAKDN